MRWSLFYLVFLFFVIFFFSAAGTLENSLISSLATSFRLFVIGVRTLGCKSLAVTKLARCADYLARGKKKKNYNIIGTYLFCNYYYLYTFNRCYTAIAAESCFCFFFFCLIRRSRNSKPDAPPVGHRSDATHVQVLRSCGPLSLYVVSRFACDV